MFDDCHSGDRASILLLYGNEIVYFFYYATSCKVIMHLLCCSVVDQAKTRSS